MQLAKAAAMSNSARHDGRRAARRGRRSFAAYDRWVHDALRLRAGGYRLLDSPLVSLPGVQRLDRRRIPPSAFADVHATRALLQQATERASAVLTRKQVLALQLYCEGQAIERSQRVWARAGTNIYGPQLGTRDRDRDPRVPGAGAGRISPEFAVN